MSYISRKLVQSAVALGVISAPVMAVAADFAPPPVGKAVPYAAPLAYRWDGFYAGINGGGAFGTSFWDLANTNFTVAGWMFGGQVGYNMQFGRFIAGLEADFDYADIGGNTNAGGCVTTCTLRNRYLGTGRGRFGYAMDRFFPYFTAGVAYGQLEASRGGVATTTTWRIGYTVGAGLEFATFDNWTAKAEYLFVDLGSFNCTPACGPAGNNKVDYYANVVRLGLNYRF
jgi:outer membrane immunogenic protein